MFLAISCPKFGSRSRNTGASPRRPHWLDARLAPRLRGGHVTDKWKEFDSRKQPRKRPAAVNDNDRIICMWRGLLPICLAGIADAARVLNPGGSLSPRVFRALAAHATARDMRRYAGTGAGGSTPCCSRI